MSAPPRLLVFVLPLLLALGGPDARAQVTFDDAFPLLPDFDRPVDIQRAPGSDRLFVVQQSGLVVSFVDAEAVSAVDTLLDLRAVVNTTPSWEEGMLGLAFHPDYETNGYFFVHYTTFPEEEGGPHRTIIARFTVASHEPPVADPASEAVLFDLPQPYRWHNGGQLAFHPHENEPNLYLSLGDGGGGCDPFENGQDRTTLFGTILRVNVDEAAGKRNYGIPPDNPYVGNTEGWREEIWAYGLRNPWRFSFDPATGHLWVGDVGQNQWEEITVVTEPGANLGWKVKEAVSCTCTPADPDAPACDDPDLLDPIWWYFHEDLNNSVSGGHVYHGTAVPELTGTYVYGDFVSGRVWALDFEGPEEPVNQEIGRLPHVSAFGVDADGELLVASFDHSLMRGRLYRIVRSVAAEPGAQAHEAVALRLDGANPFRDGTRLRGTMLVPGPARVALFDALGREVAVLYDGPLAAGEHTFELRASGLVPGTYHARLTTDRGAVSVLVTRL